MKNNNGFTLIELSVVILVIALVAGGVVAGKSFIASAKVLSVVSEVGEFRTAVSSFFDKYKSKPGDMSDAYDYFAKGDNSVCGNDNSSATGCNGDDDGAYGYSNGERLKAWKHLSLSGFLSGSYTGVKYSGTIYGKTNVNVPLSPFDGVGYMFDWSVSGVYSGFLPATDYLLLGHDDADGLLHTSSIDPVNAQLIDSKLDDGYAYTGTTVAVDGKSVTGCILVPASSTSDYNLSINENRCVMYFYLNEASM